MAIQSMTWHICMGSQLLQHIHVLLGCFACFFFSITPRMHALLDHSSLHPMFILRNYVHTYLNYWRSISNSHTLATILSYIPRLLRHGKIRWVKHSRIQSYEIYVEILSRCIGHQCLLLTYVAKNSRENFCGTIKNPENHENLAQRIFPVYGSH